MRGLVRRGLAVLGMVLLGMASPAWSQADPPDELESAPEREPADTTSPQGTAAQAMTTAPLLRLDSEMHTAQIRQASVDAAGRLLLTASQDKTARLWSLPEGRLLSVLRPPLDLGAEGKLYAAALSPDGRLAAVAGWTGMTWDHKAYVYLFDTAGGRLLRRLTIDRKPGLIFQLASSPDGRFLAATLQGQGGLRVWRLEDGTPAGEDLDYGDSAYSLAFDSSGRLVTSSYDGKIRLYDAAFHRIAETVAPGGRQPFRVAFSPDGRQIAVGYEDAFRVDVLAADSLQPLFTPDSPVPAEGAHQRLSQVTWSADGRTLYAAGWFRDGQSRTLIRSWSDGGHGPARDRPAEGAGNSVHHLQPLPGGGIVYTTGDPAWGTLDTASPLAWRSNVADLRDNRKGFRLSADGGTVAFAYEDHGGRPAVMALASRSLRPGADRGDLAAPQTSGPGMTVRHWNNFNPELNGIPLPLRPHERSRAAAVRGDHLLLGAESSLYLFDSTGRRLWRDPVPGVPWAVNLSADGRLAVAAFGDGTIRWFRADNGAELLAFFPHIDGRRWVLWTPSGYYDASPGGEDLIGWHVNRGPDRAGDFFPLSRFRDQFYRPDIISRVLSSLGDAEAPPRTGAKGLKPAGTADVARILPPVLRLLAPGDREEAAGAPVTLRYALRSPSGLPVTRLRVLVDGRPADIADPPQTTGDSDIEGSLTVTPPAGSGEIALLAETAAGAGAPVRLRLKPGAAAASGKPNLFVLAVGVSAYALPDLKLNYSAKDANDFTQALQAHGKLYQDVTLRLLDNAKATRAGILDGLDWLRSSAGPGDIAMLFLSGHGDVDAGGAYYYLPQNADPADLRTTGISNRELVSAVARIRGKVVLFLDTCHAGATLSGRVDGLVNQLISAENGAVVFTSSSGQQESLESAAWGNGAFTKALVEGLSGRADLFHRGSVSISGLDAYVSDTVRQLTNDEQTPATAKPNTVPDFPIAQ